MNFFFYLTVLLTIYIRFRQIAELYRNHSSSANIVRLNRVGLCVGSLAALGISVVANFQETNVFFVHIAGALMAFGLGTTYLWVQVSEQCVCVYLPSCIKGLSYTHVPLSPYLCFSFS